MPDATHLVQAFRLLLDDAQPERAEAALKLAIRVLVDNPRTRLGNRSPNIGAADQRRWSELKPRLREHIASAKIGMSVIARETELPVSTVQRSLSPAGPVPGRGITALLAGWLDRQQIDAEPPAVTKPSQSPAPAKNGHAPTPANRLTEDEAAELADYLEDASDQEVRYELQMSRELARQAAARKPLAPEALERLQRFLGTGAAN